MSDTSEASSALSVVSVKEKRETSFVYPSGELTQEAVGGITFDFNFGARIHMQDNGFRYRCVLMDTDAGNVFYDLWPKPGNAIVFKKKFFIRYRILIYDEAGKEVFRHDLDLKDRDVVIQLPYSGALGDSIAWFSMIERFQQQHKAKVHVLMPPKIRVLFEPQYPNLVFEDIDSVKKIKPYASYYLGLYFHDDVDWQPYDFRLVSLSQTAGYILGLDDLSDSPPRLAFGPRPKGRDKPYVVIATHGSSHAKHWCNPKGWNQLVSYLHACGYDVVCIDKDREVGAGDVWHDIPNGCIDDTGEKPLQERIDMIHYADFFIGLSSGLSWLAWCCKVPVVLISGICMPFGEFQTPYRVQARHSCHGCWNDTRYEFDHDDFMWCPQFKGTPRAYECTKAISAVAVINTIQRIPSAKRPKKQPTDEKAVVK